MSKHTMPPDDAKVLVCDKCLTAACWYGEFMCDENKSAGTTVKTVGELRQPAREHWHFWSDEKLDEVYGDHRRDF